MENNANDSAQEQAMQYYGESIGQFCRLTQCITENGEELRFKRFGVLKGIIKGQLRLVNPNDESLFWDVPHEEIKGFSAEPVKKEGGN